MSIGLCVKLRTACWDIEFDKHALTFMLTNKRFFGNVVRMTVTHAAEGCGHTHIVVHAFSLCMQMTRPASPAEIPQQPKQNVVSYHAS